MFKIRFAHGKQRRLAVNRLIQAKFSTPGDSISGVNIEDEPSRIKLFVDRNEQLIGTITLCLDTPDGLDSDLIFKAEVDHLRASGGKFAEVTDLATENKFNTQAFAALIHITYIYARHVHGCTDFVIEVKKRHSHYYERMLGFQRCGPERSGLWADGTVVLLSLALDHMGEQIEKYGGSGQPLQGKRSLYPYFFSKADEIGISQRLLRDS